jgi:hypothetical protein
VKFFIIASFLSVTIALPALRAADPKKGKSGAAVSKSAKAAVTKKSVTLKDGRVAVIENGLVTFAQGGKPVAAPSGRYTTREGKVLLVGNEGRLTNSESLKAEPPPQPEAKRVAPASNGQRHQTGSNL